jgi:glycosyltransferase involved in cell wall biosynthesis
VKVISILQHTPHEVIKEYTDPKELIKRFPDTKYIELNEPPFWVGFFKLDWHHSWSRYIKKEDPSLEIECWRPYGNSIGTDYSCDVDGIKHRVFPSRSLKIKGLGEFITSLELLNAIRQEISRNKIIIHFYGAHSTFITWLLFKLRPHNTPVVIQQLGGCFEWFNYKTSGNPIKLLLYFLERQSLKSVDKYLTASKTEEEFLLKRFKRMDSEFFLNGIDFDKFFPEDKLKAKLAIGVPGESKIILFVGRLNKTKSADTLIRAYNKIREKHDETLLFLVGCYREDEYFNMAKTSGATVIERSDESIEKYYQAADVYVLPIDNFEIKEFGGIGIAPLEALACNTPVISYNLKHFNGSIEERNSLGIFIDGSSSLYSVFNKIFNNNFNFPYCRSTAQKYFNIKVNSKKMINIYWGLYRKYYGINS